MRRYYVACNSPGSYAPGEKRFTCDVWFLVKDEDVEAWVEMGMGTAQAAPQEHILDRLWQRLVQSPEVQATVAAEAGVEALAAEAPETEGELPAPEGGTQLGAVPSHGA